MSTDEEHIPEQIREVLHIPELDNLRNRDGWAKGEVTLIEAGAERQTIEEAFIELFNDEGTAGEFGGVKFMAEQGGALLENYAFATREAFEESSQSQGWVVTEWTDPDDPEYGEPAPQPQ
jgi:hypothetical protein